jgi:hypothetical protein
MISESEIKKIAKHNWRMRLSYQQIQERQELGAQCPLPRVEVEEVEYHLRCFEQFPRKNIAKPWQPLNPAQLNDTGSSIICAEMV